MKLDSFTPSQKRALAVLTIIALIFGAYFLRNFFILIVVAAISAFLFSPIYNRLNRKLNTSLSATLTLLSALLIVIIPLAGIIALAVFQISETAGQLSGWLQDTDLGELGANTLSFVNEILGKVPFVDYQFTENDVTDGIATVAQNAGSWLLEFLSSSASSVLGALTSVIIYIYVFISFLVNKKKIIQLFRHLNPLGDSITDMYLAKAAAMVKGTVGGQFVIALCQGLAGAVSIYIAGFHEAFFIFFIFLSALSIIPLGSGIVTIPLGVGMALFGNVWGGILVILWHLFVTTNIDNILRPILVPKQARLDPALMILAVFSGIAMFGFWGLVIGPVIMILIVTTVKIYLAAYKGIPLNEPKTEKKTKKRWLKSNRSHA